MRSIRNYLSLIKFSHSIFAMPFAIIGFVLGIQYFKIHQLQFSNFILNSNPTAEKLILVILCMITARSAAMAFNRYLDHSIDARNPRTAIREIPAGIIKPQHALMFTILSSLIFIVACYCINLLCFFLSFIALFVILFYSYTKRFTALCHLVLGLGLSLAPIGAFLAVTGVFYILPLLFSILVICWVSGFDIIYALQDEEFDKHHQLHSIPVLFGKKNALQLSKLLHLLATLLVIIIGIVGGFCIWYWMGAFVFIFMLVYQHSIVKPTDLSRVNIAFMTANGMASIVFSIFVVIDVLRNL